MPVGPHTITIISGLLDPQVGQTIAQLHEAVGTDKLSRRAVRYALEALQNERLAVRRGRLIFAALSEVDPATEQQKEVA